MECDFKTSYNLYTSSSNYFVKVINLQIFLHSACNDTICSTIQWCYFLWNCFSNTVIDFFPGIFGIHIDKISNHGLYQKFVFKLFIGLPVISQHSLLVASTSNIFVYFDSCYFSRTWQFLLLQRMPNFMMLCIIIFSSKLCPDRDAASRLGSGSISRSVNKKCLNIS